MKTVLLRGYYGYKNSGDDALYYSIVDLLSKNYEINKIITLSKKELRTPHKDGLKVSYIEPSNKNIFLSLLKTDALIFGGGSQLQDYGSKHLILSMLKTLMIVSLANFLRKKVIYLGISIGPLETVIGNLIAKLILKKSDYVLVRDTQSLKFLKEKNINLNKIDLIPDLVVNLSDQIAVKEKSPQENLIIGVNILSFFKVIRKDTEKENSLLESLKYAVVKTLIENPNHKLRLFSFQEDIDLNDSLILQLLKEGIESEVNANIEIIPYHDNPIEMMEEISNCDRFIGMRLHSTIFSYTAGIPQMTLSYHPKCRGFTNLVGYHERTIINLEDGIPLKEDLYLKIKELISFPSNFMPSISVKESKENINQSFSKLKKLYNL